MRCILTDDQLEVIFTETDEEIGQIEEPIGCLIERTKQKCERCTRFFSNKAELKQPNYENSIRKGKSPHNGKTINYGNNLEKHVRSCEKAPTYPAKQQLRQRTLDEPTSSKNRMSAINKLIVG